jgi:dynein heavy chain
MRLNEIKGHVDADTISHNNFKANNATIDDPDFNVEKIMAGSKTAGGLCDFIINITLYYNVVVSVEPKKLAVAEAKA